MITNIFSTNKPFLAYQLNVIIKHFAVVMGLAVSDLFHGLYDFFPFIMWPAGE